MENHNRPSATILVSVGAVDDATWRKLGPALYNLFEDCWLPDQIAILGVDGEK